MPHGGRSPSLQARATAQIWHPTGTPVVPGDDQLITPVTPLRRKHPHPGPRREMPDPPAQLQAAFPLRGLPGDISHHAEAPRLLLTPIHRPIISCTRRPSNRKPGPAYITLSDPEEQGKRARIRLIGAVTAVRRPGS
jgi:hypothetical protein